MPVPFQIDEELLSRRSLPPDGVYTVARCDEVQTTAPDGSQREAIRLVLVDTNAHDHDVYYSVRLTRNGLLSPSCKAGQLRQALAELEGDLTGWEDVVGKAYRFETKTTTLRDGRSFTTFLPVELVGSGLDVGANGFSEEQKARLREFLSVPKAPQQVFHFLVKELGVTDMTILNSAHSGRLADHVPEVERTAAGQYVWKRGA